MFAWYVAVWFCLFFSLAPAPAASRMVNRYYRGTVAPGDELSIQLEENEFAQTGHYAVAVYSKTHTQVGVLVCVCARSLRVSFLPMRLALSCFVDARVSSKRGCVWLRVWVPPVWAHREGPLPCHRGSA